jgi:hypothetical protein
MIDPTDIESFWGIARPQHFPQNLEVREETAPVQKSHKKKTPSKELCKTCNIPLVNGHCKNESGIPDIAWAHRVGRSNVGAHVDDHLIPEEFRAPPGPNRRYG